MSGFRECVMVAGCCGFDAHIHYSGSLSDGSVAKALDDVWDKSEDAVWDDFLERYVPRESQQLPIVLATSVEQDGEDVESVNYITPAVKWAIKNGWKYIRTPAHRNPNTNKMVAMLILYPPNMGLDNTMAGSNL